MEKADAEARALAAATAAATAHTKPPAEQQQMPLQMPERDEGSGMMKRPSSRESGMARGDTPQQQQQQQMMMNGGGGGGGMGSARGGGGVGGGALRDSEQLVAEIRRFRKEVRFGWLVLCCAAWTHSLIGVCVGFVGCLHQMLEEQQALKARLDSRQSLRRKPPRHRRRTQPSHSPSDSEQEEEDNSEEARSIRARLAQIERERDKYAQQLQQMRATLAQATQQQGTGAPPLPAEEDGGAAAEKEKRKHKPQIRSGRYSTEPRAAQRRPLSPAYDGAEAYAQPSPAPQPQPQPQSTAYDERPIGGGAKSGKPKRKKKQSTDSSTSGAAATDSDRSARDAPVQWKRSASLDVYPSAASAPVDSLDALAAGNSVLLHRLRSVGAAAQPQQQQGMGMGGGGYVRPASAHITARPYSYAHTSLAALPSLPLLPCADVICLVSLWGPVLVARRCLRLR